jgi:hypothetical protein
MNSNISWSQRRTIQNYIIRERHRQGLKCPCNTCKADRAAWKGFAQAMGVALLFSAIAAYVAFKVA